MKKVARRCFAALLLGLGSCVVVVDAPQLTEGCDDASKPCGDRCVSLRNPKTGCGSDDCTPCNLQNATARCNADGDCVKATCAGNWEDCDDDGTNGCETDLAHNPLHCGECDNECPELPHAEPGCEAGRCSIDRCEDGWGDCDRDLENGCEVDVARDQEHCGGCFEACPSEQVCEDGSCVTPE